MRYEYKVLPAPKAGLKGKGIKTAEDRFANALATTMNILGAEGWEFQRTETLPAEKREGLMSKTTVYQNMMVFRRALPEDTEAAGDIVPPVVPAVTEPEEIVEETPEVVKEVVEETVEATDTSDGDDDLPEDLQPSGRRLNFNRESM